MPFSFSDVFHLTEKSLHIITLFRHIPDERRRPQIPLWQALTGLLVGAWTRCGSLLEVDQKMRLPEIKRLLGSSRPMVASDSTFQRLLRMVSREHIGSLIFRPVRYARSLGAFKTILPSGRQAFLACTDGSVFGGLQASVLYFPGNPGMFLDFEPFKDNKKGKELPATRSILQRYHRQRQKNGSCLPKIDFTLEDGLYFSHWDINQKLQYGIFPVVKTTEETSINVIKEAQTCFTNPSLWKSTGVSHGTFFDEKRLAQVTFWSLPGLFIDGVEEPFTVYQYSEVYPKETDPTKAERTFFVLIPDRAQVDPRDAHEMAHRRWDIETNGFKELNQLAFSKHKFSRDTNAKQTYLSILFLAFNIFMLAKALADFSLAPKIFQTAKKTKKFFAHLLYTSLIEEPDFSVLTLLSTPATG